jgi:tRNA/tmRNA/rRNA uracil-C5-methylase (TrmA/RlmC/RlmD family)
MLSGAVYITESLAGLSFSVQPFAPFPSNLTAYEAMISKVRELAAFDERTLLVDVCCGIGISCLLTAKWVKRAIGIDENEHFINGANKNAEMNNMTKAYFVHGVTEQILADFVPHCSPDERIVCYFDTTHERAPIPTMKAVRKCARVEAFVYVSDSAYTFASDCQRHLMNEDEQSKPFELKAVELFDFEPLLPAAKIVAVFARPHLG